VIKELVSKLLLPEYFRQLYNEAHELLECS
jgi:hypothetical protein